MSRHVVHACSQRIPPVVQGIVHLVRGNIGALLLKLEQEGIEVVRFVSCATRSSSNTRDRCISLDARLHKLRARTIRPTAAPQPPSARRLRSSFCINKYGVQTSSHTSQAPSPPCPRLRPVPTCSHPPPKLDRQRPTCGRNVAMPGGGPLARPGGCAAATAAAAAAACRGL